MQMNRLTQDKGHFKGTQLSDDVGPTLGIIRVDALLEKETVCQYRVGQ
jgi:hypothetical protein